MAKDKIDSFSFVVTSDIGCSTKEEAWDSFYKVAENKFKWVRGYKYWRTTPELFQDKDFDMGETHTSVRARVVSLMSKLGELAEANIRGPYPSMCGIYENSETVTGFGLAPKKEKV